MLGLGPKRRDEIPTVIVDRLAAEGRSESEIIAFLRKNNYSNEQISKAMNHAIKFRVSGAPTSAVPENVPMMLPPPPAPAYSQPSQYPTQQPYPMPPGFQNVPPGSAFLAQSAPGAQWPGQWPSQQLYPGQQPEQPQQQYPEQQWAPPAQEPVPSQGPPPQLSFQTPENVIELTAGEEVSLEELVEEIIEERWAGVEAKIASVDESHEQMLSRLSVLEQHIVEAQDMAEKAIDNSRASQAELSERLQAVETRAASLERAFKEFLPALTENIRSLSSIVDKAKSIQ